jgi:hypothetical protein
MAAQAAARCSNRNSGSMRFRISDTAIPSLCFRQSDRGIFRRRDCLDTVRAETNDFYKIVNMVPVHLPPNVRDDIAQSILVALLEGTLRRDQVRAQLQQFVASHNRMFPTNFAKFGDGRLVSLDARLFDDGTMTLGDTITRGLWD